MSESGIKYGFPNPKKARPGITFQERCNHAKGCGCSYAHLPVDLIKNKTEAIKIGKEKIDKRGDLIPREEDIERLYPDINNVDKIENKVNFVFHLEPEIEQKLEYYSPEWREKYINFVISVAYKIKPAGIVVHPGRRDYTTNGIERSIKGACEDLQSFIRDLQRDLQSKLVATWIGLENRSGHMIEDLNHTERQRKKYGLLEFYENYGEKITDFGLVIDVEQAYTMKKKIWNDLRKFIDKVVKGHEEDRYKIHEWHLHDYNPNRRYPAHHAVGSGEIFGISTEEDYNDVKSLLQDILRSAKKGALVLTEVPSSEDVEESINYIENVLRSEDYEDYKKSIKL